MTKPVQSQARTLLFKLITWVLAIGCFYLVYGRIEAGSVCVMV